MPDTPLSAGTTTEDRRIARHPDTPVSTLQHLACDPDARIRGAVAINPNAPAVENFWSFTKRRLNKLNGVKVNFHLHLKECEWRYGKESIEFEEEMLTMMRNFYRKK